MGYFGIFSAVLNGNSMELTKFLKDYFKDNISQHENSADFYYRDELLIYPRQNGWVIIKWPRGFFSYEEISELISKHFKVMVSAINVHDGDFWEHQFYKNGILLDTFHSAPDYFEEINEKTLKIIDPGDPFLIATELKIDIERIKPYFNRERGDWKTLPKKAFPEDIYHVSDGLVFIDFWRKLGIRLPEEEEIPAHSFTIAPDYVIKSILSRD